MIICIPASLLRGFEEALLAAVPEPSYLLMPTIATRCCWWLWPMILSESVLVQMMIISLPEPSTPTKGCEWPWWGFCRDDGLARSLRAGFFPTLIVDLFGCSLWWGSNICWWHRPFFGRRLLVVFNTISLAWITKRRLEFPGTKSLFPLSPQLQREISS